MGEIAEMMLDGTLCVCCGEYLGADKGYPIYCSSCEDIDSGPVVHWSGKISCPTCGKLVKKIGLNQHMRAKHGVNH